MKRETITNFAKTIGINRAPRHGGVQSEERKRPKL